jgi:serine/threonine-protein kinase
MATVYLARLSGVGGFQRFVAIKRLHSHLAYEPEFIEMFVEEARLAARIHHPNVVPILEIGTIDQSYYIVMEYVEGGTLGQLLVHAADAQQRVPIKVGLRIVLDTLAGLQAAHELADDEGKPLGIVHRDVSPQNVLVGVDGSARLGDFGVARATSKLPTTRAGHLKGKPSYMAPEQAQGQAGIDRRADVFAAGIVLWEVLACRRLFKGDGEVDTLNRVLELPIPSLRAAAPTVPTALEAVVAKALQRDREQRFATAGELSDALEGACRALGALGTPRDVAAHVDAVLGRELKEQRDQMRAGLAQSGPRPVDSTRSSAPPSLPTAGVPSVPSTVISNRPPHQPSPASQSAAPAGRPSATPSRRRTSAWAWGLSVAGATAVAAAGLSTRQPGEPIAPPALRLPAAAPPAVTAAIESPSTSAAASEAPTESVPAPAPAPPPSRASASVSVDAAPAERSLPTADDPRPNPHP